ncbi:putative cmp dcmp deaminase zinc-binding protein [Phaeomoniella chlamydospora]|uniref:Putative cmp dcmp deaminase zinc-binding protein n=1 Tax=Phaeomoniella chlamydospora TaxID=158046 RepID=A0A0G2GE90_PHACM|nr:putative cmp dcmp deaminase zinc-binding protein [Phaeomoniella chlamydospora]
MPRLQDGMASSNTPYTKYEKVLFYDKKMRFLATDGRPVFLSNQSHDATWPRYIPWARRAITLSAAHKIIMIHRKFLSMSFTNAAFAFTRRTCLAASKTILKEFIAMSGETDQGPTFWTHQAFSVAACIIIFLELLHQESLDGLADTQYSLVLETLEILSRIQKRSMIAFRGVKLLKALQKQVGQQVFPTQDKRGNKRGHDNNDGTPRKRQRLFDITSFIQHFHGFNEAATNQCPTNAQATEGALSVDGTPSSAPPSAENTLQQQVLDPNEMYGTSDCHMNARRNMVPMDFDQFYDLPMMNFDNSRAFENLLYLANKEI